MRIPFGSVASLALCFTVSAFAAEPFDDKFRQLEEVLPTPNTYRTASGAPGHAYWQQRADYTIRATLDEAKREITGSGSRLMKKQHKRHGGMIHTFLPRQIHFYLQCRKTRNIE